MTEHYHSKSSTCVLVGEDVNGDAIERRQSHSRARPDEHGTLWEH